MAGDKTRVKPKQTTAFAPRRSPVRPLLAVVCAAAGVLALLAWATYAPGQEVFFKDWLGVRASEAVAGNPVGTLGATYAALSNWFAGYAGAVFVPVFALWLAYVFAVRRAHVVRAWRFVLMAVTLVAAAGLADMVFAFSEVEVSNAYPNGYGGAIGNLLYSSLLLKPLGPWGSGVLLGLVYLVGLIFVFLENPGQTFEGLLNEIAQWRARRAEAAQKRREEKAKLQAQLAVQKAAAPPPAAAPAEPAKTPAHAPPPAPPAKIALPSGERKSAPAGPPARGIATLKAGDSDALFEKTTDAPEPSAPVPVVQDGEPVRPAVSAEPAKPARSARGEKSSGPKIIEEEAIEKAAPALPVKKGDYVFPTLDLLAPPQARVTDTVEFHQERAEQLVRTLAEFGVKVSPTEIHTGPVITRYEVTPAPGVRVEKIVNLDKNLALALKAEGVRIIAPVPGKGTVGIEVPNRQAANVCLREIIESRAWADAKADIPVVLGKDVTGKAMVTDLTKMPHALIAGATGAGKTVCINAIIASLLFKLSPDDLRFIMVDPKIVEMQVFNDLPHMLVPVVISPKKVPAALKYLISEMERRYQLFARIGARNIAGFNAKILQDKDSEERAEELDAELSPEERAATRDIVVPRDPSLVIEKKKLPYIVCIIDELADLMMVAPADIETCVARLAQLARAAGIHLILATQRPSVNVITGVIKANLPCRIAFKVASKVDSRTILDAGGADTLIGRGDMLFIPPGTANLTRAQGAFVSDDEITAIVEFLKRNGPPEYAEDVQQQIETADLEDDEDGEGKDDDEGWDDSMVPAAIDVLKATKRASTSMLQRRLKIGYNRAARIMEILEAEGIVGPENGSSPREILKDLDTL